MLDRIKQMAKEADPHFGNEDGDIPDAIVGMDAILRFAQLVAEDCAKVCNADAIDTLDASHELTPEFQNGMHDGATNCADAIRACYGIK